MYIPLIPNSQFYFQEKTMYRKISISLFFYKYSLMHKKTDKTKFKNCISEKFMKQHNFFTCISPDYVFHESPKEFWKNNHFENMRAVSLGDVKTHFGKLAKK